MGPRPFVAKQNDKVVIALRQVRVDWHFFLFWPSRNLRAEGICGDASFGRPFERIPWRNLGAHRPAAGAARSGMTAAGVR